MAVSQTAIKSVFGSKIFCQYCPKHNVDSTNSSCRDICFNRLEEEEERQRAAAATDVTSSTASTHDNRPGADQEFLKLMNVVS